MTEKNVLRDFKTEAWKSRSQSVRYSRRVNRGKTLASVDILSEIALLEEFLPTPSTVLDVGAGTGALSLPLARLGYDVTAIDVSGEMLEKLKSFDKAQQIRTEIVDLFNPGDLSHLGPFSGAVSRWVVPHFSDWGEIVGVVASLLAPGGLFIFDMPNRAHVEKAQIRGKIRPDEFGYDHALEGSNPEVPFFYMAESDERVREVLASSGMELLERRPYGLLKSNLLIATEIGGERWRKASTALDEAINRFEGLGDLIFGLELAITKNLPPELVHGSYVVARKTVRDVV